MAVGGDDGHGSIHMRVALEPKPERLPERGRRDYELVAGSGSVELAVEHEQ